MGTLLQETSMGVDHYLGQIREGEGISRGEEAKRRCSGLQEEKRLTEVVCH